MHFSLVILKVRTRRILHHNVTEHPADAFAKQTARRNVSVFHNDLADFADALRYLAGRICLRERNRLDWKKR